MIIQGTGSQRLAPEFYDRHLDRSGRPRRGGIPLLILRSYCYGIFYSSFFWAGSPAGSIYALIALGYTMVYGIVQLINFAHGEIYMIGAFTALIVISVLTMMGWNQIAILLIAAAVAVVYSSAYGYTMEKVAYKPLRQAPRLSALISAIGMSLFLQNYVLLAQTSDFLPFPGLIPDFEFMEPDCSHHRFAGAGDH
jgi:branched-chain amino acid transport system permease protein